MAAIISMIISFSDYDLHDDIKDADGNFTDLVSISNYSPTPKVHSQLLGSTTTGSGSISTSGTSFLIARITSPKTEAASRYKCEVFGVDFVGRPVVRMSLTASVVSTSPCSVRLVSRCKGQA